MSVVSVGVSLSKYPVSACTGCTMSQCSEAPKIYSSLIHYCHRVLMHIILHLTSYVVLVASLVVGQTLIPTKIEAPIIHGAIFSIFVARFEPAPNNDNLFMLFQWAIWSFTCCCLIIYHWSSLGHLVNLLNITLTGYCLAFNNIRVKFNFTSWMITLPALLPALFLIRVVFQYIVGHCAKDLGVFSITILCCCDVAEVVHKGLMRCLLRCSSSDASNSYTISEASSLPSYTVSLQHLLSSLFLFIWWK